MAQPKKIIDPSRPIVKKFRIESAFGKKDGLIFFALHSEVFGPITEEIHCELLQFHPDLIISGEPFSCKHCEEILQVLHGQVLEIKSYGDFTSQTIRPPEKGELDEIMAQPEDEPGEA